MLNNKEIFSIEALSYIIYGTLLSNCFDQMSFVHVLMFIFVMAHHCNGFLE